MRRTLINTLALGVMGAVLGSAVMTANADDTNKAEAHKARLAKALDLSDEQSAQMEKLFKEHRPDRKAMHDEMQQKHDEWSKLDPNADDFDARVNAMIKEAQDRVAERIKDRAEMKQEMAKILTPEQQQKFQAMMDNKGHDKRDFEGDHPRKDRHCDGDKKGEKRGEA